jgi:hypothetical protein
MDFAESTPHSFIIKLWLEDAGGKGKEKVWRGYITHVPTGARRYLKDLSDISEFIREYLDGSAGRIRSKSRARDWLKRLTAKPTREG